MNDMRQMTALGRGIEDESFAIIDAEVGPHSFTAAEWQVVRRAIHSTADFEFRDLMAFSPDAIGAGVTALESGCPILVDVKMIAVGLNERRLASYGCQVHSFISDGDVIEAAERRNSTRAIESMRKAARLGLLEGAVVAIGNAPTALLEVLRLVESAEAEFGQQRPALIVGVPVGFVSAAESKQRLIEQYARRAQLDGTIPHAGSPHAEPRSGVPFIAVRGRKGGSPLAVAILHALLSLAANPLPPRERTSPQGARS